MEYKTKKVPLPDNREEIDNITKHPDFLCKDCVFMMYEGGGASWNGQHEWYFMACKKQPTGHGWNKSVDPIADGPDDETSTSIISECTDYQKDNTKISSTPKNTDTIPVEDNNNEYFEF